MRGDLGSMLPGAVGRADRDPRSEQKTTLRPYTMDAPLPEFKIAPNTWGHKKIKLKNKFGQLNDDDLFFEYGKEKELTDRLRAKLGKSEAEIHLLINAL